LYCRIHNQSKNKYRGKRANITNFQQLGGVHLQGLKALWPFHYRKCYNAAYFPQEIWKIFYKFILKT